MHDSCSFHVALHLSRSGKISWSTKYPIPSNIFYASFQKFPALLNFDFWCESTHLWKTRFKICMEEKQGALSLAGADQDRCRVRIWNQQAARCYGGGRSGGRPVIPFVDIEFSTSFIPELPRRRRPQSVRCQVTAAALFIILMRCLVGIGLCAARKHCI